MSVALPVGEIAYAGAIGASFVPAVSLLACSLAALLPKPVPVDPGEALARAAFDKAGLIHIDDFLVERPDGSLVQIDHAVKFAGGIGIVETKNWKGLMTAPLDAFEGPWTTETDDGIEVAVFDGANPFVQNESHAEAVRAKLPDGVPVWNIVLMTHPESGARFAVAHSDNEEQVAFEKDIRQRGGFTLPLEDYPAIWDVEDVPALSRMMANSKPECDEIDDAWALLAAVARRDAPARKRHRQQVGIEEPNAGKFGASLVLLVSGIACGAAAAAFWAFQLGLVDPASWLL